MPNYPKIPPRWNGYVGLKPESLELMATDEEPDHFVRSHSGYVTLFEDDESIEIGRYRAFYVDVQGAIGARMPLFDVFDSMQETCNYLELYEPVTWEFTPAALKAAKADYLLFSPNLLILDRLEIRPQYRGQGYGLQALVGMMHWFQAGAGLVAMKPFPLQFESSMDRADEQERQQLAAFTGTEVASRTKLRRYYAQLGFKLVTKTHFMIRRVDQAPPAVPAAFRLP